MEERRSRGEPARKQEEAVERRGDRKRRERESPELFERAPQKRKSLTRARIGSRAKESSDALFSDKTARVPRLLARDFCTPYKGDSFYGASTGALSRGEGE